MKIKYKGSRLYKRIIIYCYNYIIIIYIITQRIVNITFERPRFFPYWNAVFFNTGVNFLVWDVGGQEKLRPLWKSYTRCTDGIIFVVDSCDIERLEEAKMELTRTARSPDNAGVPILILANKQDLPGTIDIVKLIVNYTLKSGLDVEKYSFTLFFSSNFISIL